MRQKGQAAQQLRIGARVYFIANENCGDLNMYAWKSLRSGVVMFYQAAEKSSALVTQGRPTYTIRSDESSHIWISGVELVFARTKAGRLEAQKTLLRLHEEFRDAQAERHREQVRSVDFSIAELRQEIAKSTRKASK